MGKDDRLYALVAYCFILCIVPLVKKSESDFVRFHGRQGLAIFLCEMAVFIISIVLPFLMQPALFLFGILSFWGMIQALRGNLFRFPIIYPLSLRLDI
ncbi:MAG: hypothetical protein WCI27_01525 [Candidatus Omnitrophota bacterium]